jgi:hypothetical protein
MEKIETTFSRNKFDDAWSRSTESDYDAIMNEINDELNPIHNFEGSPKNKKDDPWGADMIKPFLAAF